MRRPHSIPGAYAVNMGDAVKSFGVDPTQLFAEVGLDRQALMSPDARVPLDQFIRLAEHARRLTKEPGLGIHLGMHMRVSAHGYLGFAAMTSRTLGDSLDLAVTFAPTRTSAMSLSLAHEPHTVELTLHEAVDFGSARDIMVVSLLVGLWQIGNALTGQKLPGRAELAFAKPAYLPRFAHFLPDVRFDAPAHKLIFAKELLSLPLIQADATAQRLALEQCERELAALRADQSLSARVAGMLERSTELPSLEEVANAFALSSRTLKRHLQDEATTFSALLDEERKTRACRLLHDRELTVENIAERLGYSDAANFTRAFRRMVGKTPREFRQSQT